MSFISQIETLLKENGISKKKMLADLGLSINSFTNWSKRGTIPSAKVLDEIANYFGVSVDYLLGRDLSPAPEKSSVVSALLSELSDSEIADVEQYIRFIISKR